MMDDRTLLEMAAKAAGLPIGKWVDNWAYQESVEGFWLDGDNWNPLTDDGDRYRLLSKLKAYIDFGEQFIIIGDVCIRWPLDEPTAERAAVRAAAEIGKAKEES